jgi:threonine dehydratase
MLKTTAISRISTQAIAEARGRISREFLDSPQAENQELSSSVGARLICKIESQNPVGSFKGRGADSFINAVAASCGPLITASAGNFGLAMAYAARRRGIAITVYAAETASPPKIGRIRSLGAEVKLVGQDFDEAKEQARKVAKQTNAAFIEDGREPEITAGAGTLAMEITSSAQAIDTILIPLGNGALLAGVGCWFRSRSRRTRIIGVCAEGAPSMALSWRSGQLQSTAKVNTIADGIAVRIPVPEALADLEGLVDDIVLVSEDSIRHALKIVGERLDLICEPAAVAGVAAVMSHEALAKGVICAPITGGNATQEQLQEWIAGI